MPVQISVHTVDWTPDLFEEFRPVPGFRWEFEVAEPSLFMAFGHIDAEHRAKAGTRHEAIMVAFQLQVDGKWLVGSKTGENIVGRQDHYYSAQVHGFEVVQPGPHTVDLFGRSASTAAPGVDGLAQVKGSFNEVVYVVAPVGDTVINQ